MPMLSPKNNKFRAAIEVLQQSRDQLVESMADEILDQSENFLEGGFLFHEFLEGQGTRLHFLSLLVSQLEQSAEVLEELELPPPPPVAKTPRKRKPRSKKPEETGGISPPSRAETRPSEGKKSERKPDDS